MSAQARAQARLSPRKLEERGKESIRAEYGGGESVLRSCPIARSESFSSPRPTTIALGEAESQREPSPPLHDA